MRLFYTERFRRSYADAPLRVQKQCDKQLSLLVQDLRHPSVRAKNMTRRATSGRRASIPPGESIFGSKGMRST